MGNTEPSLRAVIERALDDTISRLSRVEPTAEVKAILVEARRLRSVTQSWGAIPPTPAVRREMLAKVMTLASGAGDRMPSATAAIQSKSEAEGSSQRPMFPSRNRSEPADREGSQAARLPRASTPDAGPRGASPPLPDRGPGPGKRGMAGRIGGGSSPVDKRADVLGPLDNIGQSSPVVTMLRPSTMEWQPLGQAQGVSQKTLRQDAATGQCTVLVRLSPGSELPWHRHVLVEQIYVLEGALTIGTMRAREGEFCLAEPDSIAEPLRSLGGCTFLFVGAKLENE